MRSKSGQSVTRYVCGARVHTYAKRILRRQARVRSVERASDESRTSSRNRAAMNEATISGESNFGMRELLDSRVSREKIILPFLGMQLGDWKEALSRPRQICVASFYRIVALWRSAVSVWTVVTVDPLDFHFFFRVHALEILSVEDKSIDWVIICIINYIRWT